MNDPIVEEVRQARKRVFAECGDDLDRLVARLRAADSRDPDRLVTLEDLQERANAPRAAT